MITKTQSPWDKDYKENQQAPIYEPLWKKLEYFLNNIHGKSLLDYGCGDGNYSILMEKLGFNVIGIDFSSSAIEIAKNSCGSDKLTFYSADKIPDNIQKNSFDVVVMLNVLHCLSNPVRQKLLEQVRDVLKDKGYFFASVLSTDDESYPRTEWTEVEPGTFNDGSGKLFHFFTLDEIIKELDNINVLQTDRLENIHPDAGRKSSLHIIFGLVEK